MVLAFWALHWVDPSVSAGGAASQSRGGVTAGEGEAKAAGCELAEGPAWFKQLNTAKSQSDSAALQAPARSVDTCENQGKVTQIELLSLWNCVCQGKDIRMGNLGLKRFFPWNTKSNVGKLTDSIGNGYILLHLSCYFSFHILEIQRFFKWNCLLSMAFSWLFFKRKILEKPLNVFIPSTLRYWEGKRMDKGEISLRKGSEMFTGSMGWD